MAAPRSKVRRGSIPVVLDTASFPASERLSDIQCLGCESPLDFHQPDPDLPDRMLGTCDSCKSWYLLDFGNGGLEALLTRLPAEAPPSLPDPA